LIPIANQLFDQRFSNDSAKKFEMAHDSVDKKMLHIIK